MDDILKNNRRVWDQRARNHEAHTATADERSLSRPLDYCDPLGWFEKDLRDKSVLCLASGGGMQSALFAAAGARVTVVDLSPAMLEQDRRVASERGYTIRCVEASMDRLAPLDTGSFDLVFQPVSTCYVPDVAAVYREVARVLRPRGLYVSQHKQPINLQTSALPGPQGYILVEDYYRSGPLAPVVGEFEHRETGALEFLHRWDQLLGELLRSGFVLEDLFEPRHGNPLAEAGSFAHRSVKAPPYVMFKARRKPDPDAVERLIVTT